MIQQFTISDIQRTQVNTTGFAAVTLAPVIPTIPVQSGAMPAAPLYPGAVNYPSTIRHTGIPVADVDGWNLGDIIEVTFAKVPA